MLFRSLFYDRNKPFSRKVKFFDTYKADKEITIPTYYVIPKSEGKIIENLKRNQIKFKELQSDSLITVESYKIVDFKTVKNPYEGHYLHFDTQVSSGGRPQREYSLTLDMAKELSMVERNAKGKQARQYFIQCERVAKSPNNNPMLVASTMNSDQLALLMALS